jgi:hypothetical protein
MGTMKATFTPGCGGVNTIQKQHVKVNIEVQRTAKTLNQRHSASLRNLSEKVGRMLVDEQSLPPADGGLYCH